MLLFVGTYQKIVTNMIWSLPSRSLLFYYPRRWLHSNWSLLSGYILTGIWHCIQPKVIALLLPIYPSVGRLCWQSAKLSSILKSDTTILSFLSMVILVCWLMCYKLIIVGKLHSVAKVLNFKLIHNKNVCKNK